MSATKRFYEGCAIAGRCPVGERTMSYLSDLESIDNTLDWIAYCEHDYEGRDGRQYSQDCITMESARRLVEAGLANAEIASFVDNFGDYAAAPLRCCECGCRGELVDIGHGQVACLHCA